jgi:hypothetical protein
MLMLFQVGKYKNKCLTKQETKLTNNYVNMYILKVRYFFYVVFWNYSKKYRQIYIIQSISSYLFPIDLNNFELIY